MLNGPSFERFWTVEFQWRSANSQILLSMAYHQKLEEKCGSIYWKWPNQINVLDGPYHLIFESGGDETRTETESGIQGD